MFPPPIIVQLGVMVSGIVRDHNRSPFISAGCLPKKLHKAEERYPVEFLIFPQIDEFAVTNAHGAEIADALPTGMMKYNGVLFLGRDPHAATGSVLLKMHFIKRPEVNSLVFLPFFEFFYIAPEQQGRHALSTAAVFSDEIPTL